MRYKESVDKIIELFSSFQSVPFVFAGSGLSRRYLGLPDWEELLKHFINAIEPDNQFAFAKYRSLVETNYQIKSDNEMLPAIAQELQKDFNSAWFANNEIYKISEKYHQSIVDGKNSPFKAAIATYISSFDKSVIAYSEEIAKLKELSQKNVAGFITTNYDNFLESITDNFNVYIGQENLIFSQTSNIGEIYKIHGCTSQPETIIINTKDYTAFNRNATYLAAKLMTIFMENPIVFIGYSLSDPNIQAIFSNIVSILSNDNLLKLQKRIIVLNWKQSLSNTDVEIVSTNFDVGDKRLTATTINANNYSIFYDALKHKQRSFPMSVLRIMKESFYRVILTNQPTKGVILANPEDNDYSSEQPVIAIAKPKEFSRVGIIGMSTDDWLENIVFESSHISWDDLLKHFDKLNRQYSGLLPANKALYFSTDRYFEIEKLANKNNLDVIISKTIKRQKLTDKYKVLENISQAIKNFPNNPYNAIAHLDIAKISTKDLLNYIQTELKKRSIGDMLITEKTDMRRLIRIYDYLEFHPKWNSKYQQ